MTARCWAVGSLLGGRPALPGCVDAADGSGRAVAALQLVTAPVARGAALDVLARARLRDARGRRAALAGPSAAARLPGRAAPALDLVAAAVARGAALDVLLGAGPARADWGVGLHARAEVEDHELEDGLLRREGSPGNTPRGRSCRRSRCRSAHASR